MAARSAGELAKRAPRGPRVDADGSTLARHDDVPVLELGSGGAREGERIDVGKHRLEPSRLDPRNEGQLVDELRDLRRRRLDHLDVARRRFG